MLKLMTGNASKLKEFRRLGFEAEMEELGPDVKEALADPITVALQKSRMAGPGTAVEDTSLEVEGEDVGVEIKWLLKEMSRMSGRRASFRVILGINDGEFVRLYEGTTEGVLDASKGGEGFGFDPWLVPDGAGGKSLAELEQEGRKDEFSARAAVVRAFREMRPSAEIRLSELPVWEGPWQGEEVESRVKKRRP